MQKAAARSLQLNKINHFHTTVKYRFYPDKELLLLPFVSVLGLLYFTVVTVPILAMCKESGWENIRGAFFNPENLAAVRISLLTSCITLVFVFLLGTPVAFLLVNQRNVLGKLFESLVTVPTVLPPAAAGVGLLLTFGSQGVLGSFLGRMGIDIVFTPAAVVIAQFFVASGFYIQVLKAGLDGISPEIYEVSYVLGAGRVETFLKVIVPMMKRTVIAGLIVAWTRALGEFGATIMFAGNVLGKTRTVPLQIYTLMQSNIGLAASVSILLFIISFIMLALVKIWLKND